MKTEDLAKALNVSDRKLRKQLLEQGMDLLLEKALHLQRCEEWDKGGLTAAHLRSRCAEIQVIEPRFLQAAYQAIFD